MDLISGYDRDRDLRRQLRSPVLKGLVAMAEAIQNFIPTSAIDEYIRLQMMHWFLTKYGTSLDMGSNYEIFHAELTNTLRAFDRRYPDLFRMTVPTMNRFRLGEF